jgi:DNA-binding Lrp family transcriptional regulator
VIEKYLRTLEYEGFIKNYSIMRPEKFTRSTNISLLNDKSWMLGLDDLDKPYFTPRVYEMEFLYHSQPHLLDREEIIVLFELDKAAGLDYNLTSISRKTGLPRAKILKCIKKLTEGKYYIRYPVVYPPLLGLAETLFTIIKTNRVECRNTLKQLFLKFPDNYVFELEDGVVAVNHVSWQSSNIFNTVNSIVSKIKGVEDLKLFFEHTHYGSMPSPAEFYKESGWVNPSKFWFE